MGRVSGGGREGETGQGQRGEGDRVGGNEEGETGWGAIGRGMGAMGREGKEVGRRRQEWEKGAGVGGNGEGGVHRWI